MKKRSLFLLLGLLGSGYLRAQVANSMRDQLDLLNSFHLDVHPIRSHQPYP